MRVQHTQDCRDKIEDSVADGLAYDLRHEGGSGRTPEERRAFEAEVDRRVEIELDAGWCCDGRS